MEKFDNKIFYEHFLYKQYFEKMKIFLRFSVYDIQEVIEDRKTIERLYLDKCYEKNGLIRALELFFTEGNLLSLDSRSYSGRTIEFISLKLDSFLRNEVERCNSIINDVQENVLREICEKKLA